MDPDSSASSRSTYNLSNAYKNSGDVVIALEYLKKAAILGWSEAELELGENYLFGWDGIVKDLSEAKYWLKKAYSHGQKKAEKIYCDSLTSDQQSSCKF